MSDPSPFKSWVSNQYLGEPSLLFQEGSSGEPAARQRAVYHLGLLLKALRGHRALQRALDKQIVLPEQIEGKTTQTGMESEAGEASSSGDSPLLIRAMTSAGGQVLATGLGKYLREREGEVQVIEPHSALQTVMAAPLQDAGLSVNFRTSLLNEADEPVPATFAVGVALSYRYYHDDLIRTIRRLAAHSEAGFLIIDLVRSPLLFPMLRVWSLFCRDRLLQSEASTLAGNLLSREEWAYVASELNFPGLQLVRLNPWWVGLFWQPDQPAPAQTA
jgi:hypothetical protein